MNKQMGALFRGQMFAEDERMVVMELWKLHIEKTKAYNKFEHCEATIEFITIINNLFDIFNSKSKYGSRFKRPLSSTTFEEYSEYFEKIAEYIKGLYVINDKDKLKPLLCSQQKTGQLGFFVALEKHKNIYSDFVETNKL